MDVSVKDAPYWNTTVDPSSSSVKPGPAVRVNPAAAYEFRPWRVVACWAGVTEGSSPPGC